MQPEERHQRQKGLNLVKKYRKNLLQYYLKFYVKYTMSNKIKLGSNLHYGIINDKLPIEGFQKNGMLHTC
jgi:hypothetical protein